MKIVIFFVLMFATHIMMSRSLLCWVVKPVTFSILVFAIKRDKKLVMLGGETCDISQSRIQNKKCQELFILGWETIYNYYLYHQNYIKYLIMYVDLLYKIVHIVLVLF